MASPRPAGPRAASLREPFATLVGSGTSLVSVIATSNITGAVTDIAAVVEAVRAKNPEVYVVTTASSTPHTASSTYTPGASTPSTSPRTRCSATAATLSPTSRRPSPNCTTTSSPPQAREPGP
ncbi:hypothetical protein SAZ11_02130 [Streptomyces sp. FXJ1.4098]|nr:hypothetical protein [Streptomyces sp. FXJ1.4098]